MKKNLFKILFNLCTTVFLLSSCVTTNSNNTGVKDTKASVTSDSESKKTDDSEYIETQPDLFFQEYSKDKSLFNGNTDKFILANPISCSTLNAIGQLKQTEGNLTVYQDKNLVGFGSPYLMTYYYLFTDKKTSDNFFNAVQSYLSDFNNKKLERKNSKSIKKYGSMDVTLYWGQRQKSTPNNGTGKCSFGYKFIENSPYFTISLNAPVYNKYSEIDFGADKESLKVTYYFTKAQVKELANYLTSNNIDYILSEAKALNKKNIPVNTNIEGDSY